MVGWRAIRPHTLKFNFLIFSPGSVDVGVPLVIDGGAGRARLGVEADARAHGVGRRGGRQAERVGVGRGPGPLGREA